MQISVVIKQMLFLIVAFSILSCSNEEDKEKNLEDNYLWYFSGKINGEPFLYGQKEGETTATYSISTTNTLPSTCTYSENNGFSYNSGIYPDFNSKLPTMDIEFIRMYLCSNPLSQKEVFNSLFPVKEYVYAADNADVDANAGKVGMYYSPMAESRKSYSSFGGSQSGSYFEVTKSEGVNNLPKQIIEGVFSVTLYNTSNPSDKVKVTEGHFKMVFTL